MEGLDRALLTQLVHPWLKGGGNSGMDPSQEEISAWTQNHYTADEHQCLQLKPLVSFLEQQSQACLALGLFPSDCAVSPLFLGLFFICLFQRNPICLLLCPKSKKTFLSFPGWGKKKFSKPRPKCCCPAGSLQSHRGCFNLDLVSALGCHRNIPA